MKSTRHEIRGLSLEQAVVRACCEPTLVDALTWICVWESERVVKQTRSHETWETCFRYCIKEVLGKYSPPNPGMIKLTEEQEKIFRELYPKDFPIQKNTLKGDPTC